jgi:hypothetical protein
MIMLSTDGFSNSFQDDAAFFKFGSDVRDIIVADGLEKVSACLPDWLTEITERGSGDDISLGIVCRPAALVPRPKPQVPTVVDSPRNQQEPLATIVDTPRQQEEQFATVVDDPEQAASAPVATDSDDTRSHMGKIMVTIRSLLGPRSSKEQKNSARDAGDDQADPPSEDNRGRRR